MPNKHISTSCISTAELNQVFRRIGARENGPQHPALLALIAQNLVMRLKGSDRGEDKPLLRMIEKIAEIELELKLAGTNVEQELQKAEHGSFGPVLDSLVRHPLNFKVPLHDPGILAFQYTSLWNYEEHHHPLPARPRLRNEELRKKELVNRVGEWLKVYWKTCGQVLREYLCFCQQRSTEPIYSSLYGSDQDYTTRQDLFHRLLAHLHNTEIQAIKQDLKPSRRKILQQRM